MGVGKPRGIRAGRKLVEKRKENRWAQKHYNQQNIPSRWKKPFGSASHAKGIVIEKLGVEAKQPNSAVRKCVRVQLKKNGKKITAYVPYDGGLLYINENDEVMVSGFGRSGHAVGDIPGVRFLIIGVKGKSMLALFKGKAEIVR